MWKPGVYWRFYVSKFLHSKQGCNKQFQTTTRKEEKTTKTPREAPNLRKLFLMISKPAGNSLEMLPTSRLYHYICSIHTCNSQTHLFKASEQKNQPSFTIITCKPWNWRNFVNGTKKIKNNKNQLFDVWIEFLRIQYSLFLCQNSNWPKSYIMAGMRILFAMGINMNKPEVFIPLI